MSLYDIDQTGAPSPARRVTRLPDDLRRPSDRAMGFTARERAFVGVLAALIVPAEPSGPGATDVGVVEKIEALVALSPAKQRTYRAGLKGLDRLAQAKWGGGFLTLQVEQQIYLLRIVESRGLGMRRTALTLPVRALRAAYYQWTGMRPASRLFRILVRDVMALFYSSEAAWAWLGYAGPPFRGSVEAE